MFNSREEIINKLNEYKDLLKNESIDYNTVNEITIFCAKYGFLADLRESLFLLIEKFLTNKPDILSIEYQKTLSIFPEDDEIFEKFINFINNIKISAEEKNIYIKTYIKVLSSIGKFGKAINILNELIKTDPNNVENLILAANVYETEGHIDKAVNLYLQAIDKIQNIDEKIKIREQISTIDPANKENIMELVELYIEKKEFEQASKILRLILRYNQNDPEVLYKIAEIDLLKGNYRGATIAIKKAIELDPLSPKYRYLLGMVYFHSGTKVEAEKILDQVINELYQNNNIKELKQALQVLNSINSSYSEKYKDIIEIVKEQEERLERIERVEKVEEEKQIEQISQNYEKEQIIESQIASQESKIEETINQKIQEKNIEEKKEERETLSKTQRKSTGVFIRKDIQTEGQQKSFLSKKENLLIKESTVGIKQTSPFIKKDFSKSEEKPTLDKSTLDKPTLVKPTLEKPTLGKSALEKNISDKPLLNTSTENPSSTVILQKEQILIEQDIKEQSKAKEIQEKEETIEITVKADQQVKQENIKNIEIEMYENLLNEILQSSSKPENIITNSLRLIDNIYQLKPNKYRLFLWVYRVLLLSQIYGLAKIRQKLVDFIKEIGFEKALEYIKIQQSSENPIFSIFENLYLSQQYEEIKDSIKEFIRQIIIKNSINNFIKIYKKLQEKFPDKTKEIDNIFIDVLNEEKNIDFIYIFLNISSPENIEYLSAENIELLSESLDYSSIIENTKIQTKSSIIVKCLENEKLKTVEKIIKKTISAIDLLIELYSHERKINIQKEIEDINVKLILMPLLNKNGYYEFYSELLNYSKLNKINWLLSYLITSKYPTLIFMNIENFKDTILKIKDKIKSIRTNNEFKKEIINIIIMITEDVELDVFNNYINNLLEKYEGENEQFMLSLIQCWYNKKENPQLSNTILEKLELIIDEIKEKELIDFYKMLKQ